MTITGPQLRAALIAAGIPPHVVSEMSDSVYMPCRSEWLSGDFHRWFLSSLEAIGIRPYENERGDCDDFSDWFVSFARWAHRRTPEGKGFALPLGRLNFARNPSAPIGPLQERHALVWAITSDKNLVFVEPQVLFRTESLTVPQLNSATRCTD